MSVKAGKTWRCRGTAHNEVLRIDEPYRNSEKLCILNRGQIVDPDEDSGAKSSVLSVTICVTHS